jgi:osmotically-inducible protein OsmY
MRVKHGGLVLMFVASLGFAACSSRNAPDPTDHAEQALKQANLNDVDVDWDKEARVAHLKGTVESPADRARAEEVATAAVGTSGKVLNEVTVKRLNESTADNLDGQIRSDLKRKIGDDQVLRDRNIDFDVNNGMVTVKGDVRTVAEKNHVTDIVKSAPGVKDMANSLEIKPKN